MLVESEISMFVDALFEKFQYIMLAKGNEPLVNQILKILIGTQSTTRLGPNPPDETIDIIRNRIRKAIDAKKEIEISCVWGAIKTVRNSKRKVDLAELFALEQLKTLTSRINELYEPGIKIYLYVADLHYTYIYNEVEGVDEYCNSLGTFICDKKSIIVCKLSDLCKKIENVDYQCNENYLVLKEYWEQTYNIALDDYAKVSATKKLHEIGWVGEISHDMRQFYLKRMKGLYPEKNNDYWVDKLLRCFAFELFISQNDLFSRKNAVADISMVRVPPKSLPHNIYSNRIRMRITPENIIKHSAPPWTVVGAVSYSKENKLHARLLDSNQIEKLQNYECFWVDYQGIEILVYDEEWLT